MCMSFDCNPQTILVTFLQFELNTLCAPPPPRKGWEIYEPVHEISNNVVCATSKASDQPAHTRSLIRAFASHLSIL